MTSADAEHRRPRGAAFVVLVRRFTDRCFHRFPNDFGKLPTEMASWTAAYDEVSVAAASNGADRPRFTDMRPFAEAVTPFEPNTTITRGGLAGKSATFAASVRYWLLT